MPMRMLKIEEEELVYYINEISSGNEEALEKFYSTYGRSILALILSIVKSYESAEEVLQDVLMAIVTRNTDKPINNVRGWLFKVIENIAKKKAVEDRSKETEELSETEELTYEDDVLDKIENSVDQINALKHLSQLEQQCVIMRVFWHLKLPQVAAVMELSYTKVKSIYYYAIKKLRKYYEERSGTA